MLKKLSIIIVAAGKGQRFGHPIPKQYHYMGSKTVLEHTINAFQRFYERTPIQVVCHQDWLSYCENLCQNLNILPPVIGGEKRQESVYQGLLSLKKYHPDHVLIHDAARPGVSKESISDILKSLAHYQGAIAALNIKDTVQRKIIQENHETFQPLKASLWRIQTPQGFHFLDILKAHEQHRHQEFSDDSTLAQAQGLKIVLTQGSISNEKITHFRDLEDIQKMISFNAPCVNQEEFRTGIGYDVHGFSQEKSSCRLCGIDIPHTFSLKGHSDADVGLHALTDALLGALSKGDIGLRFPPTDPQWKNMDSSYFLSDALNLLKQQKGRLIHLDITFICQEPKISPHRDAMVEKLSQLTSCATERINIKATTTENLGFEGRKEGIAAQASVTIALPIDS